LALLGLVALQVRRVVVVTRPDLVVGKPDKKRIRKRND
jgi:hypothetical protein